MGRDAAADLITCEESENVNELARIGVYWIQVAEAYRELGEAYKLAIRWRYVDGDQNGAIEAAKGKIKELEGAK